MVGERRGAADEAVDRRGADHGADFVDVRRILRQDFRRHPARNGWLDQRLDALFLRHRDALFPLLARLRRRLARRIADDNAVETVGMTLGKSERGGAAHRQAGKMRLLDRQRVEKPQRVGKQRIVGIAPRRCVGRAVAALVVAQHAVGILQRRRLLIPHRQRGRERIGENQAWRIVRSVDLIIDGNAVGFDFHIGFLAWSFIVEGNLRAGRRALAAPASA